MNHDELTSPSSLTNLQWILIGAIIVNAVVWLQYMLAHPATTNRNSSSATLSSSKTNHNASSAVSSTSSVSEIASRHRESKRRIQHALTGSVLVLVSYFIPPNVGLSLLIFGAVGIMYVKTFHVQWYHQAFGPLLRPSEVQSLPGAFYFVMGVAFTMWLVPIPYARYATMCLSWADPMAAWAGQYCQRQVERYSETTHTTTTTSNNSSKSGNDTIIPSARRRLYHILSHSIHSHASVAGCLACFATAFVIGYFGGTVLGLSSTASIANSSMWMVLRYASSALVCTLAEACPVGNDNLLIPIATALSLYLFDNQ